MVQAHMHYTRGVHIACRAHAAYIHSYRQALCRHNIVECKLSGVRSGQHLHTDKQVAIALCMHAQKK